MINQSIDNFKKSLEDYLEKSEFLYAGDVINSVDKLYTKKLKHTSFSAEFMKDVMIDIYNYSFQKMFENCKEVVVHRNNFSDIHDFLRKLPQKNTLLFYSHHSNNNLNLGHSFISQTKDLYLPDYFIKNFKVISSGIEVSAFYSPEIKDSVDDCHFYIVDKPIQSLVYSLQNMSYKIHKGFSSTEHVVKIPVYNCDFEATRVRVINTQKLREEKINSILYDN